MNLFGNECENCERIRRMKDREKCQLTVVTHNNGSAVVKWCSKKLQKMKQVPQNCT